MCTGTSGRAIHLLDGKINIDEHGVTFSSNNYGVWLHVGRGHGSGGEFREVSVTLHVSKDSLTIVYIFHLVALNITKSMTETSKD